MLREGERKLNLVLLKEETFWKQRGMVTCLVEGDKNTRYFRRKATTRMDKIEIKGIKDSNGACKPT